MGNAVDHAAYGRRVFEPAAAADLVETEPDQRLLLHLGPARGTGDLFDRQHLAAAVLFRCHARLPPAHLGRFTGGIGFTGRAIAPACHDLAHFLAAPCRHPPRVLLLLQGIEGGTHHVVGVGATERLGDHVLHAEHFEHRTGRTAGNDARAWRRRAQHHLAGAVATLRVVMQGAPLAQRHAHQAAPRRLRGLADRLRHLARLAVTEANPSLLIADHDQGSKTKALAAFHHLGHTIDVHQLVFELAIALLAIAIPVSIWTSHLVAFPC